MPKHSTRHSILSRTATHDKKSGDLRAVIETPKGSRNKYRYDPECDCFELATTLPEGMAFHSTSASSLRPWAMMAIRWTSWF
jgi:inorganic pyrophosphatase